MLWTPPPYPPASNWPHGLWGNIAREAWRCIHCLTFAGASQPTSTLRMADGTTAMSWMSLNLSLMPSTWWTRRMWISMPCSDFTWPVPIGWPDRRRTWNMKSSATGNCQIQTETLVSQVTSPSVWPPSRLHSILSRYGLSASMMKKQGKKSCSSRITSTSVQLR